MEDAELSETEPEDEVESEEPMEDAELSETVQRLPSAPQIPHHLLVLRQEAQNLAPPIPLLPPHPIPSLLLAPQFQPHSSTWLHPKIFQNPLSAPQTQSSQIPLVLPQK